MWNSCDRGEGPNDRGQGCPLDACGHRGGRSTSESKRFRKLPFLLCNCLAHRSPSPWSLKIHVQSRGTVLLNTGNGRHGFRKAKLGMPTHVVALDIAFHMSRKLMNAQRELQLCQW